MDSNLTELDAVLGADYSPDFTTFNVWSPKADSVMLRIYKDGHSNSLTSTHQMHVANSVWILKLEGDHENKFYTYQVWINGIGSQEVTDPYAKAVGINGKRAMVVNLANTNPDGWEDDSKPTLESINDIIIYELHIRDFSIHPNSNLKHKGKYLAFTEEDTKINGVDTGISHLKDLGVTHIHLLPAFDFRSIDESKAASQYNWGYDPLNYNTPEGSYATDAKNGAVRINEFKKMVMSLHRNGLRVIMDVVYNHTGATKDSNFSQLNPGYYYRLNGNGAFSNASACGNETASEKPMMRKFILESILHWTKEYHIDGFRFDLMGIHDIETMNIIASEVKKIDPTILLYGEGWTAGDSPLPENLRATKDHVNQMEHIAVFSDEMRDGIKGHWADHNDNGFVSGKQGSEESVKFGIVAATDHPGVDYSQVNYTNTHRALSPQQTINYVACHDDLTLWDKLKVSTQASDKELTAMHLLANTIVLTSQGIPFLHAGADFLRTKKGDANSYKSPDSINQLDWLQKVHQAEVYYFYKQLISMRKNHPVFKLKSAIEIQNRLTFHEAGNGLITYSLDGRGLAGETWSKVFVAFNGSGEDKTIDLPPGSWKSAMSNWQFFTTGSIENKTTLKKKAAIIFYQDQKP